MSSPHADDPSLIAYQDCTLCPRTCHVDRAAGEVGVCGEGTMMRIAWAGLHKGEEPPISAPDPQAKGSGTIFFSGCPLGCAYCQNHQISHDHLGSEVDTETFVQICLALEAKGAANINLITGTHFIPSIILGLIAARDRGLTIPVVWNSSGYETAASIDLLAPWVDIFLPDLKTFDKTIAATYCGSSDYPEAAARAVERMIQVAPWCSDDPPRGTMVRHLVIPGRLDATEAVLSWFSDLVRRGAQVRLSLMVQYVDPFGNGAIEPLDHEQYDQLIALLDEYGIDEGFVQELAEDGGSGEEFWIPDFTDVNPFPAEFADTVWHPKLHVTIPDRNADPRG